MCCKQLWPRLVLSEDKSTDYLTHSLHVSLSLCPSLSLSLSQAHMNAHSIKWTSLSPPPSPASVTVAHRKHQKSCARNFNEDYVVVVAVSVRGKSQVVGEKSLTLVFFLSFFLACLLEVVQWCWGDWTFFQSTVSFRREQDETSHSRSEQLFAKIIKVRRRGRRCSFPE